MRTAGFWRWERAFHRSRRGGGAGLSVLCLLLLCAGALLLLFKTDVRTGAGERWEREAALFLWKTWYGSPQSGNETDEEFSGWLARFILKQVPYYRNADGKQSAGLPGEIDPSYRGYLESAALLKEYEYLIRDLEGSALLADEGGGAGNGALQAGNHPAGESDPEYRVAGAAVREGAFGAGNAAKNPSAGEKEAGSTQESAADRGEEAQAAGRADTEPAVGSAAGQDAGSAARAAGGSVAGKDLFQTKGAIEYLSEQLADYDFLMKHFYTVHPTAAAGRELMRAKDFLEQDFSLKPGNAQEEQENGPQILIYHTHSQEHFSDYSEQKKQATIVGVGNYLTELLEQKGYRVYHDVSVYDLKNGKLDRSRAYSYALEGVTAILQKYPSIQVVLDIHRDGVRESTHLLTDINGKKTATIMFFNGTSETPDGPIEYLRNPYRTQNLAFSFQMKLCADAIYPGFTRNIYLKGLRYNQHLRPCSALIEVGAQNNTYEEARNAMEPLSELLDMVLRPR